MTIPISQSIRLMTVLSGTRNNTSPAPQLLTTLAGTRASAPSNLVRVRQCKRVYSPAPLPAVLAGLRSRTLLFRQVHLFGNSNGSGVYNIDPMGLGTYTLVVSAPGYASASIPGVTITQGNTTTQNVQLVPQNDLEPGNVEITAESCAPANNALDPGETVTVNLPVVNDGGAGATTVNLVGTLAGHRWRFEPIWSAKLRSSRPGCASCVSAFHFHC